jgi:hypothetical protein
MTVSRAEAESILKKWSSESLPIVCTLELGGCTGTLNGMLIGMTPSGFVISHLPLNQLAIAWSRVLSIEYSDLREAGSVAQDRLAGSIDSILVLYFRGGSCQLVGCTP